jgi:hypothetical protein
MPRRAARATRTLSLVQLIPWLLVVRILEPSFETRGLSLGHDPTKVASLAHFFVLQKLEPGRQNLVANVLVLFRYPLR